MNVISTVKKLESLFKERGFSLYFVGGSVRDYLLFKDFDDVDLVTDATPEEMKSFIENADFTFSKFGFVKVKFEECKFDITTLRIEEGYADFRHPKTIRFTKKLEEDVLRRDFTVNGLYMDTDLHVYDYVGGVDDLNKKVIKMIGEPLTRLKEDPLRIIRALRFALTYKFNIDEELSKAIKASISLLDELNLDKIKQDIKKIKNASKEEINKIFIEYNIQKYIDVIK
jgi:tRNA nucleotidyltransferase/poly(A) polymerase